MIPGTRYELFLALADDTSKAKDFDEVCRNYLLQREGGRTVAGPTTTFSDEWRTKHCKELVRLRFNYLEQQRLDSRWVSLPGGFNKIRVSDLATMENLGAILLLLWCFYAIRRENHAILSLVDMDENSRKLEAWFLRSFTLVPQRPHFSAQQLAYAYRAVSQRFVFLFSTRSRPLFLTTILLCVVPALVSSLHLLTDIIDFWQLRGVFEPTVYWRFSIELVLLAFVWLVTCQILKFVVDTSLLLNGWYLAARDVWMRDWHHPTYRPAPRAHIDIANQTAAEGK
jgi:hypothetical protein